MKLRDVVGYFMLLPGVAAMYVGLAAVSRDIPYGWAGMVVGMLLNLLSYRLLVPRRTKPPADDARAAAPPSEKEAPPSVEGSSEETTSQRESVA
jgi:uncharacterized membrane protein YfcA